MFKHIVFTIFLSFISNILSAQSVYEKNERFVKIVSKYEILCDEKTEKMVFRICLPQHIEHRQSVGGVSFSVKPDRIYDERGKKYAEFEINEPHKLKKIEMVIPIKLYKSDYNILSKIKDHKTEPDSILEKFLIEEKFIEKDYHHIQKKAAELKANSRLKTVQHIFYYVNRNMKYKIMKDTGAKYAIMNMEGDCFEYSHLFVALCRANGIPARPAIGYVSHLSENQAHAWAEVYFDNIGWVPFEPTGSTGNFKNMSNNYVYLYFIENDGERTGYTGYQYRYWGEKPMVRNKITIQ